MADEVLTSPQARTAGTNAMRRVFGNPTVATAPSGGPVAAALGAAPPPAEQAPQSAPPAAINGVGSALFNALYSQPYRDQADDVATAPPVQQQPVSPPMRKRPAPLPADEPTMAAPEVYPAMEPVPAQKKKK